MTTLQDSPLEDPQIEPSPNVEPQQSQAQWEQVFSWLADLPAQFGNVMGQYTSQIKVMVALIAVLLLARLALAIIDAINAIPLFSSVLELVGLGYVSWFAFQNLLKADSRRQLLETARGWKIQFLGES